ncbi:TetR/AcrR family transcriptional regulator [Ferrimicrobium acidiphilum]|uniref:DNA-binding transcriptional regulator EnvR n=1 Tax=Ferrimicrobium acidiphilum DSM 19497 TaxID=1121877 RepID=A0A0D8FUU7_9ACTN|nr:TetR/AcrR family transcriptional regulator [Ferrimicrobium acidiphilum]KJE77050.1 DNA-binding transcriptional regulator EnvR [Ferrimicrobium acidiphilum DSM 19497]MCL5054039.1 TetR family transcriptional regulator [Gammaproteobacteria bacterium]
MGSIEQGGRRERKKALTRERLIKVARELFAEQGFPETTVQQITEAADVSERTFFRYFESKDDLLLLDLVAFFDRVEFELRVRPIEEEPLVALYQSMLTSVRSGLDESFEIPMVRPHGLGLELTNQLARTYISWELRIAEILAQRLGGSSDCRLRADVTAKLGISVLRAAFRELFQNTPEHLRPEPAAFPQQLECAFVSALDECDLLRRLLATRD